MTGWPAPVLSPLVSVACGLGKIDPSTDCESGVAKGDDGACYPSILDEEASAGADSHSSDCSANISGVSVSRPMSPWGAR